MKRRANRLMISLKITVSVCISSLFLFSVWGWTTFAQEEAAQTNPVASEPVTEEFNADIPRAPTAVPQEAKQFVYNSHGMRDPFVSLLINKDLDPGKAGLAAMKISEIKIQGIQIGLGRVAIVLGTDGKAYNMEVGQTLLDGKVTAIESGKVVFEKVILDPFGREKEKQRIELYLHR